MMSSWVRIMLSDKRTRGSEPMVAPGVEELPRSWGVLPIDVGEVLP